MSALHPPVPLTDVWLPENGLEVSWSLCPAREMGGRERQVARQVQEQPSSSPGLSRTQRPSKCRAGPDAYSLERSQQVEP